LDLSIPPLQIPIQGCPKLNPGNPDIGDTFALG
jgi:hypothetical protein